ncbi:hypothetical protein [Geminocystis sp.]|uniref:hypothetical protein n=1 Tax=Geminocystis sp. TaxID=2664100 RepID=UPI00359402FA
MVIGVKGKILGIYYPMIDYDKVKKAKEKMDLIMKKTLEETRLTEEEYLDIFMSIN